MKNILSPKWAIAVKILPLIIGIILLKIFVNYMGWEIISQNSLFNSIISANVFLLGFLLAGTLSDYKESERLPGEMAASLETISDELVITHKNKKNKETKAALVYLHDLSASINNWFLKKEKSPQILEKISGLNDHFLTFEKLTQPNFIVRMKQEQNNIRRMFVRVKTIRDTSFVSVGYAIAEIITFLLIAGFMLTEIEPFYESLFFLGVASFLMIYMIALIKDLDDPFDHYEEANGAAMVSIQPLQLIEEKLKKVANTK